MLCSIFTEPWAPLPIPAVWELLCSHLPKLSMGTARIATDTTGHHLSHVPAGSRSLRLPKDPVLPHFCR